MKKTITVSLIVVFAMAAVVPAAKAPADYTDIVFGAGPANIVIGRGIIIHI